MYLHIMLQETFMRNFTWVNFTVFSLFQVYNQCFITNAVISEKALPREPGYGSAEIV